MQVNPVEGHLLLFLPPLDPDNCQPLCVAEFSGFEALELVCAMI